MDLPDIGDGFGQVEPRGSDNVASVAGNSEAGDEAGSDVPSVDKSKRWGLRFAAREEGVENDEVRGEHAVIPSGDYQRRGEGPDEKWRINRCDVDVGTFLHEIPESLLGQHFGYDVMVHVICGLRLSELSGGGNPIRFCASGLGVYQIGDADSAASDRYFLYACLDGLFDDVNRAVYGGLARSSSANPPVGGRNLHQ